RSVAALRIGKEDLGVGRVVAAVGIVVLVEDVGSERSRLIAFNLDVDLPPLPTAVGSSRFRSAKDEERREKIRTNRGGRRPRDAVGRLPLRGLKTGFVPAVTKIVEL